MMYGVEELLEKWITCIAVQSDFKVAELAVDLNKIRYRLQEAKLNAKNAESSCEQKVSQARNEYAAANAKFIIVEASAERRFWIALALWVCNLGLMATVIALVCKFVVFKT